MLTESFVVSVLSSGPPPKSAIAKDAGIHIHTFQPSQSLQSTFKKSSTPPNCLAVSATHVYAAQADKAVTHVYSRERGGQEATVPFAEKITSLAFAGEDGGAGVLALGTQGGRIILWEVCTGRQVSTQASHLQPVTCLATDITWSFLLSGSEDSNVHLWPISSLLSFTPPSATDSSARDPRSPLRTLSNHRDAITSIAVGHSASLTNFSISASRDRSCIVWNYHTGDLLRTFLLSQPPLSLVLDPCDRAFYAGQEDGTIQLVSFFNPLTTLNPLHDRAKQAIPSQASAADLWTAVSLKLGAALCVDVVYEGNYLISGHASGKVCLWDAATKKYVKELADYGYPVTNLIVLPPTGFPAAQPATLRAHQVVKPVYESAFSSAHATQRGSAVVLAKYTLTAQFTSTIPSSTRGNSFDEVLAHPSFPPDFLAASLAELTAFTSSSSAGSASTASNYIALDATSTHEGGESLPNQVAQLQSKLNVLRSTHKKTWTKMVEMRMEKVELRKKEKKRLERQERRRSRRAEKVQEPGEDREASEQRSSGSDGESEEDDEDEEDSSLEDRSVKPDSDEEMVDE